MDDCDIARFVSETQRGLHRQRLPYEFKVVFTTLTFYVLATAAVLSGQVNQRALQSASGLIWAFFIGVAGMASFYLYRIHGSNRTNINMAQNAERLLITRLEKGGTPIYLKDHDRKANRKSPIVCEVNWLCQTGLIVIFAMGSAFIITRANPSLSGDHRSCQEANQTLDQTHGAPVISVE